MTITDTLNIDKLWKRHDCYKDGKYYETLLPKYSWNNLSDIKYLDFYLSSFLKEGTHSILELASGTGRATKIIKKYSHHIDAVEPSKDMIAQLNAVPNLANGINIDMKTFIKQQSLEKYDVIFSFWGPYPDIDTAHKLLGDVNIGTRGIFFHANRGCYEQKLVRMILHDFKDTSYNPDIDVSRKEYNFHEILKDYERQQVVKFSVEEVHGQAKYNALDSAMESFLNLHLSGVFNKETYYDVYNFLLGQLKEKMTASGEVVLGSGMKIFNFVKK